MAERKTCAGCGTDFGCGRKDESCWCAALPALPAAALQDARDCYCPPCLATLIATGDDPLQAVERDKG